jgi:hypothetical protein
MDRAGIFSETLRGNLEVLDGERQAPQPSMEISPSVRNGNALGLLNDLENLLAKPEERLAWCSRRGRLLAYPAQLQTGGLEGLHGAIQRGRDRDDVVKDNHSVGVGGCGDPCRRLRAGRRQTVEVHAGDRAQGPARYPAPGTAADETEANGADKAAVIQDGKAKRGPPFGLIGQDKLVDRRLGLVNRRLAAMRALGVGPRHRMQNASNARYPPLRSRGDPTP